MDTGCGGISLDSSTCAHLNLSPANTDTVVTGIAGQKKVPFLFNRTLHFPGLAVSDLNFYVNDYADLSSFYGEKIDGIIGYAFLKRYIVKIDFDTSLIRIFSPGDISYGSGGVTFHPAFSPIPTQGFTVSDNRKVKFPFYMDTGAGLCLLLNESFAKDSSMISPKRRPVLTQPEGFGGKKRMQLTVVKQLKVGPYKFRNVPTYLYDDQLNITAYPHTGGLLGNEIMRRFNIVLNYPEGEIHFTPNTHFDDEFDYAYTGMMIYDINDGVFVEDVMPGSPAELAGIQPKDEIVGINTNFSGKVSQYNKILQHSKEKINVLIKRNGNMQIIVVVPESILR